MMTRILHGAGYDESERIGFSMQLPKNLKDRFDAYCKKKKVTMSGMIQSFMQYTVNVNDGIEEDKSDMPPHYKAQILLSLDGSLERLVTIFERGDFDSAEEQTRLHSQYDALIATRNYLLGGK
jgi:hypothetical protein